MEIRLSGLGKKYLRDWIFRDLDFHFKTGGTYALTGPNGSGKSTLLRIISGQLSPTKGTVHWSVKGTALSVSQVFEEVNIAAPYLDLIEEFSLAEMLRFHGRFKPFRQIMSVEKVMDVLGMRPQAHKQIQHFSSGMKQRVKLAIALLSKSDLILLDEPSTNLDEQGFEWFRSLLETYGNDRLIIIASNRPAEYRGCDNILELSDSSAVRAN